jgi:hypothetical protein
MLQNVYLVPFVLGHHPRRLDIWHGSNWEWPEYAADVPPALLNLWDDVALQWARDISEHPTVTAKIARYVEIERRAPRATTHGPRTRVARLAYGADAVARTGRMTGRHPMLAGDPGCVVDHSRLRATQP